MLTRSLLSAALGLSLLPCTLLAQRQTLNLDAGKSEVHFTLGDPLHSVRGTFHMQSGVIDFDRQGGPMAGLIAIDARSGESGNGTRDKKMRDEELKAPSFSTVTFAPKRYEGTLAESGDSTITVDGIFTLLGTPHEISVPMHVHIEGAQCRATGSFVVPYVKWGMKDPSSFVLRVGKDVTVDLVLVGAISPGKPD